MHSVLYRPENIHLLIRVKAKKNELDAVVSEAYKTIAMTHKEEGCLEYRVFHIDSDVMIFGTWKDEKSLELHLLLKYHIDMIEKHLPLLSKKINLKVYTEIEPPITALSVQ
ncbi:antibiotic biosynthesis monooxygenase [Sulfurimonas sp. MAG313]|nr:antibiotic biosynthesis monooxygenase [Sulfurimonas sp. MAG313]MDF1880299.1 antibiotic biosynthesis monooxygenase [Sulfurimonas sp. MAG313]